MAFAAQDVIGSYRIVRPLGQGGMGTVYEVEHRTLGTHCALKVFALDHGRVELFRKRFLAEGKALARLRHPSLARVFDLDLLEDGRRAYFVMDLVLDKDGRARTLADLEPGEADEKRLAAWFAQLASALDYVHDVGIVHRDIKLNNIFLNETGGVTLGDFGIAKFEGERILREVGAVRTQIVRGDAAGTCRVVMGTGGYMAPEMLRGGAATAASDTYALGVTFFRLLTGLWYEPGTDAFRLLEPFGAVWTEALTRMLAADPARRPVRLMPLAARMKAAEGLETPASGRVKLCFPRWLPDESSWMRLFELYEPAIRLFSESHGAGADAEDVAQEIFLKLVGVLRGGDFKVGDGAGKFRSYLATLIRHELVSRWRRTRARGGDGLVSLDGPGACLDLPVDSETAAVIDAKWRLARHAAAVEHALTKTALSAQSKAVYRAYVLEERPIGDVAAAFGLSRNAVSQIKTRVERMIAAIEAEYGE